MTTPVRLADRFPFVTTNQLVAGFVPPPHFSQVRFDTYIPDPNAPSQQAAVDALRDFAADIAVAADKPRRRLRRAAKSKPVSKSGIYLDGGFGVGKTHLLASLWHAVSGRRAFGTFVEYTNLVGALGFEQTVEVLSGNSLVCIDEFELDDPGDTVLMSSLLAKLVERGVRLAATSNTLPDRLGEGRFATDDFMREIQALSDRFESIRIDGDDYRHRGIPQAPEPKSDSQVAAAAEAEGASLDQFRDLLDHLSKVHPSRYGAMLAGISTVCVTGISELTDQADALRLVVLVDRMYDRDIPIVASGVPVNEIFAPDMLAGGYRKKYRRAISRLDALAR